MNKIRYNEDHEWIIVNGDIATIGISQYAQDQLGDIVFVEMPELDNEVAKDDSIAVVESVKVASDIYAPVSGVVVEINESLEDSPETINSDALGAGWLFKIKLSDETELDELLDEADYKKFIG